MAYMQGDQAYAEVDRKWKATCRVLLGGEVGELDDFAPWLSEFKRESTIRQSDESGKEAVFGVLPYYDGSKWLAFDDVHFEKKYGPISINDCKDIDSLIEAVSERIYYTGSVVLGNSGSVQSSSYIIDAFFVYRSEQVFESKYVAYATHVIYSDCLFGGQCTSCTFGIRTNNYLSQRNFEVHKVDYSSDIYYSHGLSGCAECMFSFNLKNKRHAIGNLQLEPSKYSAIKKKLLGEFRNELAEKKRLPSLLEIASQQKPELSGVRRASSSSAHFKSEKPDLVPIGQAFSETSAIILGKPRSAIQSYAGWLSKEGAVFEGGKSCVSGSPLQLSDYAHFLKFPRDRLLTQQEADASGEKMHISEEEAGKLSLSTIPSAITKIAFFCPIWEVGTNKNNIDCPTSIDSANCLRCVINVKSKSCAYNFWPRNSETIFGSYSCGISSSFCMKCYFSKNLARCFEVDAGRNCSDCYYCHNVENCHDCILCFNVKNLRYAIGNRELPKEEYLKVKARVLAEINSQLDSSRAVRQRVFSLLEKKKK
ncbi:MAG: hypothetical protein WCT52_00970 [Candidatus Micrarchaeia archaeon]